MTDRIPYKNIVDQADRLMMAIAAMIRDKPASVVAMALAELLARTIVIYKIPIDTVVDDIKTSVETYRREREGGPRA